MKLNILVIPGDGIGPEVTREGVRVLEHVAGKWNHELNLTEGLLGGVAIHETGGPFPEETAKLAVEADATLLGAVGLMALGFPVVLYTGHAERRRAVHRATGAM